MVTNPGNPIQQPPSQNRLKPQIMSTSNYAQPLPISNFIRPTGLYALILKQTILQISTLDGATRNLVLIP
jgi:hypothetical protein